MVKKLFFGYEEYVEYCIDEYVKNLDLDECAKDLLISFSDDLLVEFDKEIGFWRNLYYSLRDQFDGYLKIMRDRKNESK